MCHMKWNKTELIYSVATESENCVLNGFLTKTA